MKDAQWCCQLCRRRLVETARSRGQKGVLAEIRCPRCKVLMYVERKRWESYRARWRASRWREVEISAEMRVKRETKGR